MSKNRRGSVPDGGTKRPQSEALSGIEGGIGLNPDGSLSIADPSLDPSLEARLARGELRIIDEPEPVKKGNPNSTLKAEEKNKHMSFSST